MLRKTADLVSVHSNVHFHFNLYIVYIHKIVVQIFNTDSLKTNDTWLKIDYLFPVV